MKFTTILERSPFIITEGALLERIRRNPLIQMDSEILLAGLIYDEKGKDVLYTLYKEYIDIGQMYKLPIIINTPTWRANIERIKRGGYADSDVNGDCYRFISQIRDQYGEYSDQILIGGLIGCKGDAYNPAEALSIEESTAFHRYQINSLVTAGVDFLIAETLPSADEALGIAQAMARVQVPYIISFIFRADGSLLDGNSLSETIGKIDGSVKPEPYCYIGNCMHPTVFQSALLIEYKRSPSAMKRIIGLLANTSIKTPEELNDLPYTDTLDPEIFAGYMTDIHNKFGTKILGGCCGTDNRHIESIAKEVSKLYKAK